VVRVSEIPWTLGEIIETPRTRSQMHCATLLIVVGVEFWGSWCAVVQKLSVVGFAHVCDMTHGRAGSEAFGCGAIPKLKKGLAVAKAAGW
jgi:hypothetical protein